MKPGIRLFTFVFRVIVLLKGVALPDKQGDSF
jgi:hypothetical protein